MERSKACESRWCCNEWEETGLSTVVPQLLALIEALDQFTKFTDAVAFDCLYATVFSRFLGWLFRSE